MAVVELTECVNNDDHFPCGKLTLSFRTGAASLAANDNLFSP